MGVLELSDVTLELGGRRILNGLTVHVWGGHVHALIGPNGAGKSTLAGAIMGLPDYRHMEGEILLDGEPIQDQPVDERARRADPSRRHSRSGLLAPVQRRLGDLFHAADALLLLRGRAAEWTGRPPSPSFQDGNTPDTAIRGV